MTSYVEYNTYYTNTWVDYMQFYIVNLIGGDLDRGLGGRSRRVSAEKNFLPSPQNVTFGGTAGDSLCS